LIRSFAGKNVSGSVEKVFKFVEREVELLGDVLYLPGVAMNTAHVKRGTAEDKVILAKAILDGLGIRSYLAFARSANAPDIGEYMAPDAFTHILLYVPLTGAKGWFLDFSTRYNGCGVVSPAIERTGALVIVGDGFEIKTVTSRCVSAVSREHAIRLDTAGNGQIESTVQFFGDTGRIRNRFANTLYREEAVHRFMAGSVSLMSLHDFRIENFESATSPLRLTVRGSGHSLATAMRGMMIIQPVHGRSAILRYVISPRREHPLVMEGDVHESERYVYRLPGEFRGEAVNGRLDFRCRFGYASITINKTRGAAELIVEKEVHVPRAEISTEEYEEFLDFCRGLSEGEQQRIILQQ
jgi:hypothetical protein